MLFFLIEHPVDERETMGVHDRDNECVILHGENSRDIRSRNLPVILYLGDPCFSSMGLEILRL